MATSRLYKSLLRLSIIIGSAFAFGSFLGTVLLSIKSNANLQYTDKDLVLKDFEQMQSLITKIRTANLHMDDIDEARKIKSKDALTVLFSRRDSDGSRGKLFRVIQADLEDDDLMEVMNLIVEESLAAVQDKSLSLPQRSTHILILQNFLTETRSQKEKYQVQFEKIRDAAILVSEDLIQYRLLKGTAKAESPSDIATAVIGKKKT